MASTLPETTEALIDRALAEDVGAGDVTTLATVPEDARAVARIVQKAPGVVFGLNVAEAVFRRLDPGVTVRRQVEEGVWREPVVPVMEVQGAARALLTAERTALNLLQRLSGVATMAARAQRLVAEAGGGATVLDTRKTTPGMRLLEKAAVVAGGGQNHRIGLFDAILIKENHAALAGGTAEAVDRARAARPDLPVEIEVRDLAEVDAALGAGADRLLLDNMTPEQVAVAVARIGGRAVVEVSGGVDLDTVAAYATVEGVDYVSIGALTHSARALDLSLLLDLETAGTPPDPEFWSVRP